MPTFDGLDLSFPFKKMGTFQTMRKQMDGNAFISRFSR